MIQYKKYLFIESGYDGSSHHAFFSEKNTDELIDELLQLLELTEQYEDFVFHGIESTKLPYETYQVISLDDFWESKRPSLRPFDRGEFLKLIDG